MTFKTDNSYEVLIAKNLFTKRIRAWIFAFSGIHSAKRAV